MGLPHIFLQLLNTTRLSVADMQSYRFDFSACKSRRALQNMALRMLSARSVSRAEAARVAGSRVTGTVAPAKAPAETVGATTIRDSHPLSPKHEY
jgi:hypothetical protein